MSKSLSNKIANMAFLCAVMVLFIHMPWGRAQMLARIFPHGIGKIAVPYFFVASGYLLARHFGENHWYRDVVAKRMKTLLLPMIIWSFLYFIVERLIMPVCANVMSGRAIATGIGFNFDIGTIARALAIHPLAQPYLEPLWFLRILFVLVLISPLLWKTAKPCLFLSLYLLIGIVYPDYGETIHPSWSFLRRLYPLMLGMVFSQIGIYLNRCKNELPRYNGWVLIIVAALLILVRECNGGPYASFFTRRISWLYTPILLAGIWSICPAKRLPNILAGSSFPIYLTHMFVISPLKTTYKGVISNMGSFEYISIGMAVAMGCMGASFVVHRFMPKVAELLFGGR